MTVRGPAIPFSLERLARTLERVAAASAGKAALSPEDCAIIAYALGVASGLAAGAGASRSTEREALDALVERLFVANTLLEDCSAWLARKPMREDIERHLRRCDGWREAVDAVHARAAPVTSWATVRRALGVVGGAPADALDDVP